MILFILALVIIDRIIPHLLVQRLAELSVLISTNHRG